MARPRKRMAVAALYPGTFMATRRAVVRRAVTVIDEA